MMRQPALVFMAISIVLLNACGRIEVAPKNYAAGEMTEMSELDALAKLSELPVTTPRGARGAAAVSSEGLADLLQSLAESGQLSGRGFRGATNGQVDLSALTGILSLLQSGQANSIFGLAQGLINLNAGSTTGTTSKLDGIMALLNAALPIIMTIAPQYAGVIQAVMTIVPLVMTFVGMFKKKAKTSAWEPVLLPFAPSAV